jgi:protein farnesyltransferase subunit beta
VLRRVYRIVGAFSVLEARLKQVERLKAIGTIMSCQHPQGGFGGGPGQLAHLASTYASIAALTILLDGADQNIVDETCAQIDRQKMLEWMLSLKMPDGSFRMHHGGEIDVR